MSIESLQRDEAMVHIYRTIDRTRLLWRVLGVLDGLFKLALLVGAALLLGFLAAPLNISGAAWLCYALVTSLGAVFLALRYGLYPMARPITDEMVARHLEATCPELDNRVINAVLLHAQAFKDSLADRMVTSSLERTAQQVRVTRKDKNPDLRGLAVFGPPAAFLAILMVVFTVLAPERTRLTLRRLVTPYSADQRQALTKLFLTPAEDPQCLQGSSLRIKANVSGVLPRSATIYWRAGKGKERSDDMPFEGSGFTYEFSNVQEDFFYRVETGDAASREYHVTVRLRPAVEEITLTCSYPEYTALARKTLTGTAGDISAPPGTGVKFAVTADRPVVAGRIEVTYPPAEQGAQPVVAPVPLGVAEDGTLHGELKVVADATYKVFVTDTADFSNIPLLRRIEAVDHAPRVSVVEPAKDVTAGPDGKLRIIAAAEDDFNLRELQLVIQRDSGGEWETATIWDCKDELRVTREDAELDMGKLGMKLGNVLTYYVQAGDGRGEAGLSRSRAHRVRIALGEDATKTEQEQREALRAVVRLLIKLQKENLGHTGDLEAWAAAQAALKDAAAPGWAEFRARGERLVAAETDIGERADKACRSEPAETRSTIAEALGRLSAGHMSQAVELLGDLRRAAAVAEAAQRAGPAVAKQKQIVALLEQLLDNPAAVLARLLKEDNASEEVAAEDENLHSGSEMAERMLKQIKDFRKDQEKVIELSNDLAEKAVDDFTDEDEQKLKDVVEQEKEWAKIFQEMATDLSKLPPQDHSLANQAKELLEVFSEVQQAAEEAERKAIELAVPHEQTGAELAETIETNIEKWLMEDKDSQAWKMEDPIEDYETPMTELPDELQDLIGELVEDEEDMEEQFDDATSGWMDSLDKGAGWDTTDGPISNMSAKGVTGNRLPNTSEIGGRSGEGRTGKSSGQFVEEEATGKGGRKTPSRLTPDPFEAGWVKDSSQEATTASTGGGKVSGQGQEGFHGPVPPPLRQQLKRLAQQQQELIDKAKRLDYGLKKYNHPRGDLPQTIELMEVLKAGLEQGEISTFTKYHRIVLTDLRDVKDVAEKQKQLWRDRTAPLPKELRDEISSAENEQMPEQYRDLIRDYFRSLAEEGTSGP